MMSPPTLQVFIRSYSSHFKNKYTYIILFQIGMQTRFCEKTEQVIYNFCYNLC